MVVKLFFFYIIFSSICWLMVVFGALSVVRMPSADQQLAHCYHAFAFALLLVLFHLKFFFLFSCFSLLFSFFISHIDIVLQFSFTDACMHKSSSLDLDSVQAFMLFAFILFISFLLLIHCDVSDGYLPVFSLALLRDDTYFAFTHNVRFTSGSMTLWLECIYIYIYMYCACPRAHFMYQDNVNFYQLNPTIICSKKSIITMKNWA